MTEETAQPSVIASWQVRINLRGSDDDKAHVPTNAQLETELVADLTNYLDEHDFGDEATVTVDAERLDK